MLGFIVAAAVGVVGAVCSTARDMHSDHLISKKELAEIEAKSNAFKELIGYYSNSVDKAYELEMKAFELQETYLKTIGIWLERVEKIEDRTKLEIYHSNILALQGNLKYLVEEPPKYFNIEMLEVNTPQLTDFHNKTQIGERTTKYSSLENNLSNIPKINNPEIPKIKSSEKLKQLK